MSRRTSSHPDGKRPRAARKTSRAEPRHTPCPHAPAFTAAHAAQALCAIVPLLILALTAPPVWAAVGILALLGLLAMGLRSTRPSPPLPTPPEPPQRIEPTPSPAAPAPPDTDSTQRAIARLMRELDALADGDLTVRATVTEDVTGVIADIVNYTIEELANLVRRIHAVAGQLNQSTHITHSATASLLTAAEQQSAHIRTAVRALNTAAVTMQAAARASDRAARAALTAQSAAHRGAEAVANNAQSLAELRRHIQQTARHLKRLGDTSQETGEIVELITQLTAQLNDLAINAGVQAAAGHSPAAVATDMQDLADRARRAGDRIAAIAATAQSDAREAIAVMDTATAQLVRNAELADTAGQALAEISQTSQDTLTITHALRTSMDTRTAHTQRAAAEMNATLPLLTQTTDRARKTTAALDLLTRLATELTTATARFRL